MEKVDQFFDFEIKNHLFDIVDKYGLRPWEAVRYEVMMRVLHGSTFITTSEYNRPPFHTRLITFQKKILKFIIYILCHHNKDYFFYLCSRDKKDGVFYDKISDQLFNLVDRTNCFSIESTGYYLQPNYKYGSDVSPDIPKLFAKYTCYKYDYSNIIKLVKHTFPEFTINTDVMNDCYRLFVTEYNFYKFLFKWCRIKRVFMVQYGIQKSMFAAANELGVKIFELQHGQISVNHPAYSYSNEELLPATKIYHPDILLTFGPYWSKNRNYPGVINKVIGNDSYAEPIDMTDTHGNKKLLVISNREEGPLLVKRVQEVLEKKPEFFFFFKLHPQQYEDYTAYQNYFNNYDRVKIVSDQQSINQLLAQCEGIFLNDSTVELEALRVGKKVFVLTEQRYQCMDFVLGEPGVYACKDVDEFLAVYEKNKDVKLIPRDDLFVKFDESVAREMIQL